MKLRHLAAAAAACLMLGFAASPARAGTVVQDQWYTFGFGTTGSALSDGTGFVLGSASIFAPSVPWTITLAAPMTLVVTDGFLSGDEFQLFDFGASIGSTSVAATGGNCSNNEVACLADPQMSHGLFLLAAGDHSLTGIVTDSPFQGGAGFFIITQVPEPGGLALLGIALVGLAFSRRRTRAAS